jgi:hypothetical protein
LKKYISKLFFIIFFVISAFISFGQSAKPTMKCDSLFTLTENEFRINVTNSVKLLETKKLADLSDDEHRNIIRAYNTIWISRQKNQYILKAILKNLTILWAVYLIPKLC